MERTRIFTLLFILIPFWCYTQTYYVAKDGKDTNEGTENAPFLTINRAAAMMEAGDICYIKEGIYRERLSTTRNGKADAPITFTNYENDKVVLSATEVINDWETHAGQIYKTTLNMPLGRQNMVYYNGTITDLARWPNNDDHDAFTVEAISVTSGSGAHLTTSQSTDIDLTGGYVWYLGAHSGTSWTRPITASASNNISFSEVDTNKWPFSVHNPNVWRNGNRGQCYVFGKLELLDYSKEWYYEAASTTLYLQIPDNTSIEEATIEYAAREQCIFITSDYVVVDGLHTFGGKVHLKGDYCTIKNGVIQHGLETIDELDNTDAQTGNGAFHIQGSNNVIENNLLEYGTHNGVWIQGWNNVKNNRVQGNIIRYFNTVGTHSSPIRSPSEGTKIIGNTIHHTGRDGIYAPRANCEIAYNDVAHCMLINNDGGLFYVVGNEEDKNTTIHHNWFHDTYGPEYADGRAAGIYLDNRSKGYTVHHNVVWNLNWSGVQMNWDANNNKIYNNTFWEVEQAMGIWLNGYVQENNKVWNNYTSIGGWEGQDIQSNIINRANSFEDISQHDFRPKAGSFLIDKGISIDGITDGYIGAAPDIGAYEFGGEFWVAGVQDNVLTSIDEPLLPSNRPTIKILPNPAQTNVVIQSQLPSVTALNLKILSVDAKIIYQKEWSKMGAGEQLISLDISSFEKGIYFVWVQTDIGVVCKKLVKQ